MTASTPRSSPRARGPRSHALLAASALLVAWSLVTWWLEGRAETLLRPEATFDRAAYTLVANMVVGTGVAVWVIARWVGPALQSPQR